MAAALSDNATVPRQHPTSLLCDGSPVCRRCGGWQCRKEEAPVRRHSDTRRPNTALAVTTPLMSCTVSPRVRPATAVGWESRNQERCWSNSDRRRENKVAVGREEESSKRRWDDESDEEEEECSDKDVMKLLEILQSKKKEKTKFKSLMSALINGASVCINGRGEDGMTPLHYAVWNGEELCVKALIVFGADINARNVFQQTPLDIATHNQRDHLVPLLLSLGCLSAPEVASSSSTPASSASTTPGMRQKHFPGSSSQGHTSPPTSSRAASSTNINCSCGEGRERSGSSLSRQIEEQIDRRLEMTLSLNADEAFALALQKQEIARFRSRCTCQSPSPQTPRPMISRTQPRDGKRGQRLLSLDGGGMRGLIQIDVLLELERRTKQKITDLFDWIVGTSTGAIVAMLLVYKHSSLSYIRDLYFRLKEEVFSKGRIGFCYDTRRLEELLVEEFGTEMKMSDVQHPKILVCAVDKSSIPLKLHVFNNCFDDQFSHQPVWKVARYTTAAPMYFTECDNYVDGGVLANNPCNDALARIQSYYHSREEAFPVAFIVSIGSGLYPLQKLGSVDFHVFLKLKFSGMFQKAQSLITLLSSAIGESEALADRCRESCRQQGITFSRFNPNIPEKIDPGVTDNLKLVEMMIATRTYTLSQKSELDLLLPHLLQYTPY